MPLPLIGRLLGTGALSIAEAAGARAGFGAAAAGEVATTEQLPEIWAMNPLARRLLTGEEGDKEAPPLEEITVPVSSSCIRTISYRGDDTITVEFIRGGDRVYTYEGSRELFEAFVLAGSKGAFFNEHFK